MGDKDDDPEAIRACMDFELAKDPGSPVTKFPRKPVVKFLKRLVTRIPRKKGTLWKLRVDVYGLGEARKEWDRSLATKFSGRAVIKYPEKSARFEKAAAKKNMMSAAGTRLPAKKGGEEECEETCKEVEGNDPGEEGKEGDVRESVRAEPCIETVCYTQNKEFCVPRLVNNCKTDVHRYCEKFLNTFPFPVEEQNCHSKPKKIYEVEMKTCPKKAKKYR